MRVPVQPRSIYTQLVVLMKVALTIIAIFTLASMLMIFESVRATRKKGQSDSRSVVMLRSRTTKSMFVG